jgi:hypothetical protein
VNPSMNCARALLRLCGAVGQEDMQGRDPPALDVREWQRLARLATHHGLAGLVSRNLEWVAEPTSVPVVIVEELAMRRRQVLAQNLARKAAAREIAGSLESAGIPFIVLKGLALAEETYGDMSLRAFNDFDVLVPMQSVDAAYQLLRELDYALIRFAEVRDWIRAGAHAAGMWRADGRSVDLHWAIAPELPADATGIAWKNTVAAPPGSSVPGLRLAPEMSIVHLAKHFHTSQYCLLRPLVDFLFSARRTRSIDTARVWRISRELSMAPVVEIAAAVAERAFDTSTGILPQGRPGLQARTALHLVTDEMLVDAEGRSRIGNWMRYLAASGGAAFTARELAKELFPPPLALSSFFNAPYRPGMYPSYYWRQLVKVLTLSTK